MLPNPNHPLQNIILNVSAGPAPRSRIRCKMCRQVLATREDMLDHGQLRPVSVPRVSIHVEGSSTVIPDMTIEPESGSSTPVENAVASSHPAETSSSATSITTGAGISGVKNAPVPILLNPKCSGYFVEPLKWMEPFLESGEVAGKIICPNKRCAAKLGNYDWAGVGCGCQEWVTPGFCINRSKVDEVM
ncbi:hypothetical protein K435DRAFT_278235 [Dendrothele bispora CBS 962.96]|uniref:protein-tyrosine-phosphatase n=1 Tax=Dendrothele bispora (strain CBS 962.96) TaxID=1314807 RepID=A0A4S8MKT6_DENBC|nr:hypothetical protein K435DRAFT_278235 [Dendrothele bispora CBS 962.96]